MSKKTKNPDEKYNRYRKARAGLRKLIAPYQDQARTDDTVALVLADGTRRDTVIGEAPLGELWRVIMHSCPPGGDDRFAHGRAMGLAESAEIIGAALYGDDYRVPKTRSLQDVLRRMTKYISLAETDAEKVAQNTERQVLQQLHNLTYGPDGTGEREDRLPDDITVKQYAQAVDGLYAQARQLGELSGAAQVLERLGIRWPDEWNGQEATAERVVAAIRSYYTTQPQGEAIREARAAERANILGMLGITVNPGAGPGTQGAVAQINNWAEHRNETVETVVHDNTLGALVNRLGIVWPSSVEINVETVARAVLKEISEGINAVHQRAADADRDIEDQVCRAVVNALGVSPKGWAGIRAVREDLIAALKVSRERDIFLASRNTEQVRRELLTEISHAVAQLDDGVPFTSEQITGANRLAVAIAERYDHKERRLLTTRLRDVLSGGSNGSITRESIDGLSLREVMDSARKQVADLKRASEQIGIQSVVRAAVSPNAAIIVSREKTPFAALSKAMELLLLAPHSHPAVHRYAAIRAKYSAEHDVRHHTDAEAVQSVISLLMGPNERLQHDIGSSNTSGVVTPIYTTLDRTQMWHLGGNHVRDWAQGLPFTARMQEAAALLLCLTDHPARDGR